MPRQNGDGGCKIRKRGCSSSSPSTTSVVQRYRLKRPILVGRRGGSTTPVPAWRMNGGSHSSCSSSCNGGKGLQSQAPISARKLASALWEMMNKVPSSEKRSGRRMKQEMRGRDSGLLEQAHSMDLDRMGMMVVDGGMFRYKEHHHGASDRISNASLMEIDAHSQGFTPTSSGTRSCLKDLNNGLMTSKELVKLLRHIYGQKEAQAPATSLVSALRMEMDRACIQVDLLIQEERSGRNTINCLKKQFTNEMSAWKSREDQRIRSALCSLVEELESEKRLRRRAERMNKKLGIELANMKTSFVKVVKEIEDERRSREIMEKVCSELVRGMGEDKAKVEELKRESAKFQEELEKEREMLQVADEWREQRIQMKLSDAKFQFEEKNAAVDRLRNELEAYLTAKNSRDPSNSYGDYVGGRLCSANNQSVSRTNEAGDIEGTDGENDEVGSEGSGLHYIELQEELEQESKMLHIADQWHDERVQMKTSKATSQFEERNAAVDRLRNELEAYMSRKETEHQIGRRGDLAGALGVEENSQMVCTTDNLVVNGGEEEGDREGKDEVNDEVGSVDSDLPSIELNVDSRSKSYSWNYATATAKDDVELDFISEKKVGRTSHCDHMPRSTISLDRGMNLGKSIDHMHDGPDQGILFESSNLPESQTRKLHQERYTSVKGLRDQILAASMISVPRGFRSPRRKQSRPQDTQIMTDQVCEGLNITEAVKAARENGLGARLGRNHTRSQLEIDPIQ